MNSSLPLPLGLPSTDLCTSLMIQSHPRFQNWEGLMPHLALILQMRMLRPRNGVGITQALQSMNVSLALPLAA